MPCAVEPTLCATACAAETLVGAGFGWLADRQFESEPWGLLVGLVIGFGAFVLRLVRLARQLGGAADADDTGRPSGSGPEP